MNKIQLNEIQIRNLFRDNFLKLTINDAIEIHKDELILCSYGKITKPQNIIITFEDEFIHESASASYIRELICEYLNLNTYAVILVEETHEEFRYKIRFAPNKEWELVVYEYKNVILNTQDLFDEYQKDIYHYQPQIGLYRRLLNSIYYFRWLDEI